MRTLTKQERAAIDAVARRFSTTWEQGSGPSDAYVRVGGKRVAVDITTLTRRGTGQRDAAKPRLRFDKAATRVIRRLQAALVKMAPDGTTVVLTITAPIRVPSKTAASLEDKIRTLLGRRARGGDTKDTIHGNRVRVRLLRGGSDRAPRVIGFVHNPDSDPLRLLNMTGEFLELTRARAGERASRPSANRWLVVISAGGSSSLEAYRYIYSQLPVPADHKKVFMVFGDGRVGLLTG
jgi:hypothetical protein